MKLAMKEPVAIREDEAPAGAAWEPDPVFNRGEGVLHAIVDGVEFRKWKRRGQWLFARVELVDGEVNLAESPRKATRSW